MHKARLTRGTTLTEEIRLQIFGSPDLPDFRVEHTLRASSILRIYKKHTKYRRLRYSYGPLAYCVVTKNTLNIDDY